MHIHDIKSDILFNGKRTILIPAFIFWLGILCGIFLGWNNFLGETTIKGALNSNISFFSLLVIFLLPVILIHLFLKYSRVSFVAFLVFIFGLLRGYGGISILQFAHSASWLLRILLMFPGISVSVLLWWLIVRFARVSRVILQRDICFAYGLSLVFALFSATHLSRLIFEISILF